jgi:hypothetical protein
MRLLDSLMRTLAGVAGALLAAGGIYLLVVAAKTSGIGLAGSSDSSGLLRWPPASASSSWPFGP